MQRHALTQYVVMPLRTNSTPYTNTETHLDLIHCHAIVNVQFAVNKEKHLDLKSCHAIVLVEVNSIQERHTLAPYVAMSLCTSAMMSSCFLSIARLILTYESESSGQANKDS